MNALTLAGPSRGPIGKKWRWSEVKTRTRFTKENESKTFPRISQNRQLETFMWMVIEKVNSHNARHSWGERSYNDFFTEGLLDMRQGSCPCSFSFSCEWHSSFLKDLPEWLSGPSEMSSHQPGFDLKYLIRTGGIMCTRVPF